MELTIEKVEIGRYMRDMQESSLLIIKEPDGMDYNSAVILLRNLGERKDTTSLEREALSAAIRLLQHEAKKP